MPRAKVHDTCETESETTSFLLSLVTLHKKDHKMKYKNKHDKRLYKSHPGSNPDASLNVISFSHVLGWFFRVWNGSTFRGTQWFPHCSPPHRCQSPRKPVGWGPIEVHWDAGAPDTGQFRLLLMTRSPWCSCDCCDLSGHTKNTIITLFQTTENWSFTNKW